MAILVIPYHIGIYMRHTVPSAPPPQQRHHEPIQRSTSITVYKQPHLTTIHSSALSSLRKVFITESARNKLSSSHQALNSLLFAPDGYPTATEDPAEIEETARTGTVGGGTGSGRERRDWVPLMGDPLFPSGRLYFSYFVRLSKQECDKFEQNAVQVISRNSLLIRNSSRTRYWKYILAPTQKLIEVAAFASLVASVHLPPYLQYSLLHSVVSHGQQNFEFYQYEGLELPHTRQQAKQHLIFILEGVRRV